ncbi:hypothetical protein BC833DRAFT_566049 [Globomyces pollinis-pini]|nr:hypothetical protein BC833DRAFT_566049 [Globomyces pollinis-pini]
MYFQIFISAVYSHAILEFPTSRTTGTQMSFTGEGIKVANFPMTQAQLAGCLDSTATNPAQTFKSGQEIDVKWKITIPHQSDPGVRVAIQFPGGPMTVLKDNVNVNDISTKVKLPVGKSSDKAVLQWFWASKEDGGFYMACSDIRVVADTPNPEVTKSTEITVSKSPSKTNRPTNPKAEQSQLSTSAYVPPATAAVNSQSTSTTIPGVVSSATINTLKVFALTFCLLHVL